MKTQTINVLKGMIRSALFLTVLLSISCSGQDQSAKGEASGAVAETKVKPPQVDIHTAVVTGNMEALRQHIAAGSDINAKDPFGGSTPLISAAVFGKPEMAKVLIEAGAELNAQNNDGSTALHTAAFFCRPEIVQMLLDKKVDQTIRNSYGATAYDNVAGSFDDIKNAYDMMGKMLGPMGLTLDYAYIQKTRPEIASMLK